MSNVCIRPECGHPEKVHGGKGCRVTGCQCSGLQLAEVQETKTPSGRRVCVDVPDGYMLTVSLVPYTESPLADEK